MPQMKPMNWKLLFLFYSSTIILFILYIFFPQFYTKPKKMNTPMNKNFNTYKIKW